METQKPRATFTKEERLTSRKSIQALMEQGKSISVFPLRLVWTGAPLPGKFPAQAAFAVSKKIFPLATDRNRVKRQMREVYRKNKRLLYALLTQRNQQAVFMLIYSGKVKPDYPDLEEKFHRILHQLEERL